MPHINRNGVKVYYESFGSGTPIVFLHPWSTNRFIWAFQLMAFSRTHQCIAVDHRGHGQSDKPDGGYAITEMAADVNAILDDVGADKAVLVGNSIGGMVAMQTCLDYPERVIGALVLSSGTNMGADAPPEMAEAMQADWRAMFSGLLDAAVSEKTKAEKPEIGVFMEGCFRVEDNFNEQVFFTSVADPGGVFNWNATDTLKNIKQPVLILAGEEDGATSVEQNQFLADNIPGSEIKVFKDVGHFLQLEQPMTFNAELQGFLGRCGA